MLEPMHCLRPRYRYFGIDYAQEALAETRRRLAAAGVTAELYQGDVREFTPPQRFDLVVSFGLAVRNR